MAGIPNQLNAFSSTFSFFENAAKNGNVATVFDLLLARVDKAAERLSDRAVESGFTDIDDTPIVATFGGEASAYGDNSLAKGLMLGQAVDVGLVSYAMGTCSFTAAATATGDDTALAITNSFATITGADIVITFGRHGSTPLTSGADLAYSTSTTSFLAVDLEFWDFCARPHRDRVRLGDLQATYAVGTRRRDRSARRPARGLRRGLLCRTRCPGAQYRGHAVDRHGGWHAHHGLIGKSREPPSIKYTSRKALPR